MKQNPQFPLIDVWPWIACVHFFLVNKISIVLNVMYKICAGYFIFDYYYAPSIWSGLNWPARTRTYTPTGTE